jgi:predicted nucleotidyltransferase
MRLTSSQIRVILDAVARETGAGARVVLYGSRVDDRRYGGDIDLLIESFTPLSLWQRARIKTALEAALQSPVDVIAKRKDATPTPFQAIALMTGVELGATP